MKQRMEPVLIEEYQTNKIEVKRHGPILRRFYFTVNGFKIWKFFNSPQNALAAAKMYIDDVIQRAPVPFE